MNKPIQADLTETYMVVIEALNTTIRECDKKLTDLESEPRSEYSLNSQRFYVQRKELALKAKKDILYAEKVAIQLDAMERNVYPKYREDQNN